MANSVDDNNHVPTINSTSNLLNRIDNNSRSPSPAADALSLLDEPMDTQQNMISSGNLSYVCNDMHNINSNSSSIISSTPIAQRTGYNNSDLSCDSDRDCNSSLRHDSFRINSNLDRDGSQSGYHSRSDSPATYHSIGSAGSIHNTDGDNVSLTSTGTFTSINDRVKTSIMGYEVMEERSRFTVFKVQVKPSVHESWFIFRRYNDFVRLNEKLVDQFSSFRLALPPKRWFGDNYENVFLKKRQRGLQAFLNNVMGHAEVSQCDAVKTFLCLDDPPGEHESLEESKALCESLEEENYHLQKKVEEKDVRISLLEEELELQRLEIENLKKTLKYEKTMKRRPSAQSLISTSEHSTLTEADQQRYAQNRSSKENSTFKKSPSRDKLLTDLISSSPTITETVHEESVLSEPSSVTSDMPKVTETESNSDLNYSKKGIKTIKSDSAISSSDIDNVNDTLENKLGQKTKKYRATQS